MNVIEVDFKKKKYRKKRKKLDTSATDRFHGFLSFCFWLGLFTLLTLALIA